jgi:protein-tyrosine phosphatase
VGRWRGPTYDDGVTDRWIELDGLVNMRDLGGLPTRDGGSTTPGRLIRSDNLQDLSEADVSRLVDELGVSDGGCAGRAGRPTASRCSPA